ncbi:FtsW/RodA/SpoVE family cell cycle protein [Ruoffia tabacinasalis]|uniref:Rod shape-determining protein RodA n=1 Tax=Ruoffia tabacinasalis TaxID=87458 RepID=A0ABS0LJ47_9LACT|nr:FtsW/RodA/SpoVE family cell cycle protein [Ruoffia tabacinasalis]MBG9978305.1 rod shape-determining protein RodA [Ruoffia tabacinasalis]
MTSIRQIRRDNENRIDYGIILNVMVLAIIGLLSVYSTTTLIEGGNLVPTLFHALWYGVGTIAVIAAMQLDSEQYWKLSTYLYGFGLLLLVLVLFFYDRELADTGATSWLRIGSLSVQPSELFKPAYIVFMARVVTEHNNKYPNRTIKTDFMQLGKILMFAAPPMILIQLQNDLGTNLVIMSITAGIILMSGISWKILAPIATTVIVVAGGIIIVVANYPEFLIDNNLVQEYQINRILDWLQPFENTQGSGYQLAQSIKAVGSGQLSGKGFGVSQVTVPVRESDFIFTTIAENFGFLGSSVLLFVYFILIYQIVQICFKTRNEFYSYIAAGVISMILFHVLENIGMAIGLLPITGVPLPFVSQGGSALLGNMIGIGLVLSMKYHHRSYMFGMEDDFSY